MALIYSPDKATWRLRDGTRLPRQIDAVLDNAPATRVRYRTLATSDYRSEETCPSCRKSHQPIRDYASVAARTGFFSRVSACHLNRSAHFKRKTRRSCISVARELKNYGLVQRFGTRLWRQNLGFDWPRVVTGRMHVDHVTESARPCVW